MRLHKRFLIRGILAGLIIAAAALVFMPKHTSATTVFDCNSNAVLYCGAPSVSTLISKYDNYGDPQHHYTDLHTIYNYFGITSDGVHSLATKVSLGQVHKDGSVWLNGQEIGLGALTAGRTNLPGSAPIPGTGAFARPPSVSFNSDSLDAYIGYVNGTPEWAILVSCGNPVKWLHPHLTISKQVQNPQTGTYGSTASFKNGDHIRYLITVGNPTPLTDTNVKLADLVPAGQVYDKGTSTLNGHAIGDGIVTFPGAALGTLTQNQKAQVSFTATASLPATQCGNTTTTNRAVAASDYVPAVSATANAVINVPCVSQCTALTASTYDVEQGQALEFKATATAQGVTVKNYIFKVDGQVVQTSLSPNYSFSSNVLGTHSVGVLVQFSNNTESGDTGSCLKQVTVTQPPAVITCDELSASKTLVQPNETITFTATGSAQHANILTYNFTVDGVSVQNTKSNQYIFKQSKDGTYTVTVTVHTDRGDATSNACEKKVDVQSVPKPVERCDLLTVTPASITVGQSVTATTNFTAENGAVFKQATYTFGDEASPSDATVTNQLNAQNQVVATHTYNKVGNYTVMVSLDFLVNGKPVNGVTDAKTCVAPVTVAAVLAATTPTPPAATPATLVNTGPGEVIGLFAGVSLIGALLHRRWNLRRSFKN